MSFNKNTLARSANLLLMDGWYEMWDDGGGGGGGGDNGIDEGWRVIPAYLVEKHNHHNN